MRSPAPGALRELLQPTKIFYKDIDQMGLVYYSRYFEFFEEARTEFESLYAI